MIEKLEAMLSEVPSYLTGECKAKLRELGPLKLQEIMDKSNKINAFDEKVYKYHKKCFGRFGKIVMGQYNKSTK